VNAVFNKRLLVVWVVLSSITLAYVWMDHSVDHDGIFSPSAVVTSSAIVMASIKVRIIFREFMEVRHSPVVLCRLTDLWVAIIAVSLLGTYFIGAWLSH